MQGDVLSAGRRELESEVSPKHGDLAAHLPGRRSPVRQRPGAKKRTGRWPEGHPTRRDRMPHPTRSSRTPELPPAPVSPTRAGPTFCLGAGFLPNWPQAVRGRGPSCILLSGPGLPGWFYFLHFTPLRAPWMFPGPQKNHAQRSAVPRLLEPRRVGARGPRVANHWLVKVALPFQPRFPACSATHPPSSSRTASACIFNVRNLCFLEC